MTTKMFLRYFGMACALSNFQSATAETPTDRVLVIVNQTSLPDGVEYRYRVTNDTCSNLVGIAIGRDYLRGKISQLDILPIGWKDSPPYSGLIGSPIGWSGDVWLEEESPFHSIEWRPKVTGQGYIRPGQSMTGFSVKLGKPDKTYLESDFVAYVAEGGATFGKLTVETKPLESSTRTSSRPSPPKCRPAPPPPPKPTNPIVRPTVR